MARVPRISDAEWDVMKVVWEREPVAASDVADALRDERDWSDRTVKTLISRLVRKDALRYDVDGKRYLYRSRVSHEACVSAESRSFLERVFDGAASPAVLHIVEAAKLSPKEIAELRRTLDRAERKR